MLVGEAEELIQTPERQLREIAEHGTVYGDCDDATVLNGALLVSVGVPVRLVAINDGDRYVHVFLEAYDGAGNWWRLDPVVGPGVRFDGLERMVLDV